MPPASPRPHASEDAVTPWRMLAWLDLLRDGVAARDQMRIWELLGHREARLAPRALLEEALALARAPAASVRAPVELLRYAWVVERLAEAGEAMPGLAPSVDADEEPAASHGSPSVVQLEFAWPRRAGAARDRRRPA